MLITGFDKMFNVYIRSARQKIIPTQDYGKTTGVVILLNNLTQPLAGLLVGVFSGRGQTGALIVALSLAMAAIGAVATIAMPKLRQKKSADMSDSPVQEGE